MLSIQKIYNSAVIDNSVIGCADLLKHGHRTSIFKATYPLSTKGCHQITLLMWQKEESINHIVGKDISHIQWMFNLILTYCKCSFCSHSIPFFYSGPSHTILGVHLPIYDSEAKHSPHRPKGYAHFKPQYFHHSFYFLIRQKCSEADLFSFLFFSSSKIMRISLSDSSYDLEHSFGKPSWILWQDRENYHVHTT